MHFGFYVFGFQAHIVEEYMSLSVSSVSLFWLVGFTGDDAPRFMCPSGIAKPRMLGILAGMDQKDSCSGMNNAGIAGDPAPRAVFLLPFVRPMMLRIMTGMHQKDSCPRCTGKLEFHGSLLVIFSTAPCIYGSQLFGTCLPEECVRRFFWETTSGMVSVCSAFWVDSGYMFCVSSRRLHGDFSYFLRGGGTLDPLVDSRFFLHTWLMRKWQRSLSFRQWAWLMLVC